MTPKSTQSSSIITLLTLFSCGSLSAQVPKIGQYPATSVNKDLGLSTQRYSLENANKSLLEADRPVEFDIKQIKVVGNTILNEEIAKLTAQYIGKKVSFDRLFQLKQAISDLYLSRGFPNSGAFIPPQKVKNGVVELVVIEGGIGEINVTGLNRLSENYVKSRLGGLKPPLKADLLLDRLYVLRQDPRIESVSAELATGLEPGSSILEVKVVEAKAWSIDLNLDNYKSPAIGTFARSLRLSHLNLLGYGDAASIGYVNTEGSNSLDFSYSVPYSSKGRIGFAYGFNDNDVVEEPFSPLDIENKANFWRIGLDYDVISKAKHQLNLGLDFTRQHSETSLLGSPFALAAGADSEGNINVSALRFSQNYVNRGDDRVLALRSQFNTGLDIFDATLSDSDEVPDGKFFSWLGQAQYVKNLADDFPLLLRGEFQLATDELVSLEQYRLGGASSVRGYRRDLALADNAFFLSAETRIPVLQFDSFDGLLQVVPFADFGTGWTNGEVDLEQSSFASVGLGLKFNAFEDRLNARLDWGIPLIDVDAEDEPITFSLGYSL